MRERVFIALLQLLLIPTIAFSQTGSIKGTVTDKNTGETLIGATVMINGTTKGTITDFDGNYTLENVEPGTYSITFSYVAYTNIQHDEVEVKAGEASTVNVIMEEATTALEEVKVVGKANREAEAMLLMEQKSAVLATQAIGAKELSRKGVSDAEGAVTKISGISKQEGAKNVIVRGLGDRYNSSTLNGFPIPSEDPEYKNISLDYFTSDMIQAVGVNKVFGANQWGDVGGAHIDIKSKELIKSSELELSLSLGTNNQSFGKEFLKTEGVNSFGFANIHNGPIEKTNGGGREYIDEYSFPNSLDPIKKNTPLNSSITIAGGRKFGGDRHRFFLVGAYGTDSYIEEGVTRNTTTTESVPFRDFNYTRYEQFTSHLIMGNLDFDFNKSRIFYNALYIHTNNQYFSEYFGKEGEIFQNVEDLGSQGLLRRQQINDNSILVNQLVWKWDFLPRFSSDAGVSYNYVTGNEPDRRVNYLSNIGNNQFELRSGDARQQRFYNELVENDINVKASITYQLTDDVTNKSSLSVGYSGRFAQKDFIAPIYNKDWEVGSSPLPIYPADNILLDNDFNQENLDAGNFTVDLYEDKYDVEKFINGGYASLIYQFGTKFTANVGLRVDQVYIKINYDVNKGGSQGSDKIDSVYFLPSVNLKYDINNKNSIRFGSSVT
ncbi:MAG TPA: hypothetical protein DDX98_08955, partial [Bacteroidales bacterium]|nr:hypothetical protein [Bacteroidales bacterium]